MSFPLLHKKGSNINKDDIGNYYKFHGAGLFTNEK